MKKRWIKDNVFYKNGSSVVINGQRYFAPLSDEQMIAAGYTEYVQPEPEPVEITLDMAKSDKLMQIEMYDMSDAVNSFTIGNQDMWLTVNERQQIATQISANEAIGRTEMTRWFNGNEFTFSLEQWKQMLTALEVYAGDALNVTENHKAQVNALETIADVEAFDITAGYPQKLNFNLNNQ